MSKVTANWFREFQMQINDGRHQWVADEPEEVGGSDVGPNPFDMLLASLAASKCFCVKKCAVTSKLPVQDVIVEVQGDFADAGRPETFKMKAEVKVKGNLSEEDLGRLLRAAETCPLGQAVTAATGVETTISKL